MYYNQIKKQSVGSDTILNVIKYRPVHEALDIINRATIYDLEDKYITEYMESPKSNQEVVKALKEQLGYLQEQVRIRDAEDREWALMFAYD